VPVANTNDLPDKVPPDGVLRVGGPSGGEANAKELKVFQPDNPILALGLAVSHLMTISPFCNLKFGEWSRILVGQVNRKHCLFVMQNDKVVGFGGWALTDMDKAEAWLSGRADNFENVTDGDSLVINVWEAATLEVNAFMRDQMRKIAENREMIYAKRVFKDGSVRPVRLKVNQFVSGHITAQDL